MSISSSSGVSYPPSFTVAPGSASQKAHRNIPLFFQQGTKKIPITQKDALIYQISGDRTGNRIRVDVNYKSGQEIVITPVDIYSSKPYLYGPKNLKALDTSTLVGDVQLGGFGICEDRNTGKLLFIQKVKGNFWFIPGGLVEETDQTVWDAAKREIAEETGVIALGEGSLSYFYNSITQTRTPRQNLMQIFMNSGSYDTSRSLNVPSDATEEILAAKWWDPAEFWAMYIKDPKNDRKFSLPSIELCFSHFIEAKQKELNIDLQKYQTFKDILTSDKDDEYKILFDLSFLGCTFSGAAALQTVMAGAKQKADRLLQAVKGPVPAL